MQVLHSQQPQETQNKTKWYVQETKEKLFDHRACMGQTSLCHKCNAHVKIVNNKNKTGNDKYIKKTRLFKYIENFTSKKTENFQIKTLIFFIILFIT